MSNWWASSRGRACLKKRQEICISWAARAAVDHRAVAFPHRAKFVKYVLIVKYFCSVFVIWNYLAYVFLVLTVQYLNELSSKKRLLDCITINHPLSFSLLETPTSSPVEQLGVSLTWQPPKHRSTVNAGHETTQQQKHSQQSSQKYSRIAEEMKTSCQVPEHGHNNSSVIWKPSLKWLFCSNAALHREKALRGRKDVTEN